MVFGHAQDALQKGRWKTDYGDWPYFSSSSEFDAPAKIGLSNRFITNRGIPLYGNMSSSCRNMKSLATPDTLSVGSPLQSSWIQRLIPESMSHCLDQSRNAEVRTGDHCLIYRSSGKEIITELSFHGDLVQQSEGHPDENSYARIFPSGDRLRQHTLNRFDSNLSDIEHGASEDAFVTQPEAHVSPIQLPTVQSLLPGHAKKGNEGDLSFIATDAEPPAKSSNCTRQSNGMTQSFHIKGSNFLGLAAAGNMSGFNPFSVAYRSYSIPDSFSEVRPTSALSKETSLGVRKHCFSENRNIAHVSPSARASTLVERNYYLNEQMCPRLACASEIRSVDNRAESRRNEFDTELRQASLRVDDTLSTEKCRCVGSKSFLLEDRLESVCGARDRGESVLPQAVGGLSGVNLETKKDLKALASETEYFYGWKCYFSEPNAASKSDACASTEKGNACDGQILATGTIMPPPPHEADLSGQICDVNCAKPVQDGVMPVRCVQQELSASQGFQFEKLGLADFNFKGMLKKSDAETTGIEWPFPPAPAIKDTTQQQSGSLFSTGSLNPDLCADLLPTDKLTGAYCSCVISERRNRGELRSAMDLIQPCLHSLEMDGFSVGDVPSCWHSYQKLHVDDVLYSNDMQPYFKSNDGAHGHEMESPVFKRPQEQENCLISGVAVLSRPEFGTGIELAEDGELQYKYGFGRILKHKSLVSSPHVTPSALRRDEPGPKNCVVLQRLQNASVAEAKLQTAGSGSEPLLRDKGINIGHIVKSTRPAAVGYLNLIKREINADRGLKMENDEYDNVPSVVLGKHSRVEGLQGAGSMCKTASDVMRLDANMSTIGLEFCSKPKMWIQRWCTTSSMAKTQNSSVLDEESKMSVVNNGKSQTLQRFIYLGASENQETRGKTFCETPEVLVLTQSENHKSCNVQPETSMVVSGLGSDATIEKYHWNRKQSLFMKRLFTPSAAAMAIVGTTAGQIHATKPQKNGLFGIWSSPKDLTGQVPEPQEAAFNPAGSTSELAKGFMLSSAEYSVTPAYV